MALYDEFPAWCGGFIWDFKDQALWQDDPITGQRFLAYGGDLTNAILIMNSQVTVLSLPTVS